jgi:protein-tyrosine phosphatase
MTLTITRELTVEVAHNIRHIGGYRTVAGRTTSEQIIRSAGLQRLTPAGVQALADRGVATIVDLRSTVERERDVTPDVSGNGIEHIFAPVFEQDASPVGLGEEFRGFASVYVSMLETGREAYRVLFETIAFSDRHVLFHCAAGKDRTGVATALLLDLVGVPEEAILADFALSASLLEPLFETFLPRMTARGIDEARGRALLAANPGDMASTLAHIRNRFGSAEGYVRDIGLSADTTEDLKARLLA